MNKDGFKKAWGQVVLFFKFVLQNEKRSLLAEFNDWAHHMPKHPLNNKTKKTRSSKEL